MKYPKLFNRSLAALTVAGLLCGTAVAASTVTTKMIEANYMGIKIVVDGVEITPTNANGTVVEPFASEGTTYLPVRAIGEALGKQVTWDGDTATVYIGDVPGQETNWMMKLPPYQTNNDSVVYDGTNTQEHFSVAGVEHTSGVALYDPAISGFAYALWNTNLQYTTMTFTIGHVDGAKSNNAELEIRLDGEVAAEYELTYDGAPQTITVPLNRAANVGIYMNAYSILPVSGAKLDSNRSGYAIYDISFS